MQDELRKHVAGVGRTDLLARVGASLALVALALTGVATRAAEPASAGVALPQPLALRQAFDLAMAHNKDVQAADLAAEADRERVTRAKGKFDPALFAEAARGATDYPSQSDAPYRLNSGSFTGGLRQRLVTGTSWEASSSLGYTDGEDDEDTTYPLYSSAARFVVRQDLLKDFGLGANQADVRVARNTWRSARENSRDARIGSLQEVEAAYWGLYYAQADLRVRQTQLDRANRLVSVAESQVRVGQVAPIEVTRARSSAAAQAVAILDARSRISLLQHRLLRLMGILDPAVVPEAIQLADSPPDVIPDLTLGGCMEIAWSQRPDCAQARLNLDTRQTREQWAANQCLPSLELYGAVGAKGLDDTLADSRHEAQTGDYGNWEAGLALEVPLGNRVARGEYRAARYERLRAAVQVRAVQELAVREVADALDELHTAEKQIETARQAKDLAAELLRAEERSFNLGRSDSLDVLNAQASLASAERDEVRARVNYATALANLYAVRGDFLQAKGLPADPEPVTP